jgi:hypothetical protein
VDQRRHLIAQNARFLVLAAPGKWPNLASRVLKLTCARLPLDWQQRFGYPVLAVETFVDPQRFHGTCYKSAGWEQLGATQGCERDWQDFYTDTQHPERTIRRLLKKVDSDQLKDALTGWMQTQDPALLEALHIDGKVVKNAQPAPACPQAASPEPVPAEPCEIPPEMQKLKADMRSKPCSQPTKRGAGVPNADPRVLPRPPPAPLERQQPRQDELRLCAVAGRVEKQRASCPPHPFHHVEDFVTTRAGGCASKRTLYRSWASG